MRSKSQFMRELNARDHGLFDNRYIVPVLNTYPTFDDVLGENFSSGKNRICDKELQGNSKYEDYITAEESSHQLDKKVYLTKKEAEKLYWIVMPFADRNLFVTLKQEHFAGKVRFQYFD